MSKRSYFNQELRTMAVGDRIYKETTREGFASVMRGLNPPHSRRQPAMLDMVFKTSLWTAVSAKDAGVTRLIVCCERTQ